MIQKLRQLWQMCISLGPLAPLMLFSVLAPGLGALALIGTSTTWYPLLSALGLEKLPVYLVLGVLLAGLSLVPTHAVSLVGGMVFGVILGPTYALLAVVGASYLSYVVIRSLVKDTSYQALLRQPKAEKIYQELMVKSGYRAVLFIALIRLSPVMPFAATNVILAAAKVKASYYIIGSLIGLAPRIILVAAAGAGLSELDLSQGSHVGLAVLGVASTIVLAAYVGRVFKKVSISS